MPTAAPASTAVDTRTALILAAVRLFADRGVNGVSLREINAASGTKNHSAASYYFGDKQGLVGAILAYGAQIIQPTTVQLLGGVDQRLDCGEVVLPKEVLVAGFGANVSLVRDPGFGRHFVRTLSQIVFVYTPDYAGPFNQASSPLYEKMAEQLGRIELNRDPFDIRRSLILTGTASLHTSANFTVGVTQTPLGDISLPGDGGGIDYLFNYFAGAYGGQVTKQPPIGCGVQALLDAAVERSSAIPFPLDP